MLGFATSWPGRRGCGRCLAMRGVVPALVASRRGTRAVSSAGERFPDTEEVTGSNPVRPTRSDEEIEHLEQALGAIPGANCSVWGCVRDHRGQLSCPFKLCAVPGSLVFRQSTGNLVGNDDEHQPPPGHPVAPERPRLRPRAVAPTRCCHPGRRPRLCPAAHHRPRRRPRNLQSRCPRPARTHPQSGGSRIHITADGRAPARNLRGRPAPLRWEGPDRAADNWRTSTSPQDNTHSPRQRMSATSRHFVPVDSQATEDLWHTVETRLRQAITAALNGTALDSPAHVTTSGTPPPCTSSVTRRRSPSQPVLRRRPEEWHRRPGQHISRCRGIPAEAGLEPPGRKPCASAPRPSTAAPRTAREGGLFRLSVQRLFEKVCDRFDTREIQILTSPAHQGVPPRRPSRPSLSTGQQAPLRCRDPHRPGR